MKITDLQVNGLTTPLGYDLPYLTFSWRLLDLPKSVSTVQMKVIVATDRGFKNIVMIQATNAWNNQLTESADFLQPMTRYYWQVVSEKGTAESWFETAKLDEPWQAKWLTYEGEPKDSVIFQKQFNCHQPIASARLYLSGFGLYELQINDQLAQHEYLLPGYHSYDLNRYYQTFDVTKLLNTNNTLMVTTGNGWFKGRFVFEGGQENLYGDRQQLIAELHIQFANGHTQVIGTDSTWQTSTSKIQANNIYDGETIDYTRQIKPLNTVLAAPSKVPMQARLDPPVIKKHSLKPLRVFYDDGDQLVIDYGQEITGWVETKLPGDVDRVKFRFSELLQNKRFYIDNLRTAKQEFEVINDGRTHQIRPHFTFFGFRYVAVTGLSMQQAKQVVAYCLQSKMQDTFRFGSSNPKLSKLIENAQWSQCDNSLSIPTDCPQRDERMGWTGDVTLFSNTACYNADTKAFYANYLHNLKLEQSELAGSVPFFVPTPKIPPRKGLNPFLMTNGASTWGDVATVLPINLWHHFKDLGLLAQSLPIMQGWVDYLHQRDVTHGDHHLWDFDQQLGDWLALDNNGMPIGATDPALIASIYYYRSVTNLVEALQALSKPASTYEQLARQIKTAIMGTYFENDDCTLKPLTQTGLALLLRYHVVPTENARVKLAAQLDQLVEQNGNALDTGFIGTPELLHALVENGFEQRAFSLLMREETPSWLFEVNQGATTIWERWNSILPDGTISGTEMNSLNHYANGSVEDFVIEKMLGYHLPTADGQFLVTPVYTDVVNAIEGHWQTPNGEFYLNLSDTTSPDWQVTVTVPSRSTAKLMTPDQKELLLKSGSWIINLKGPEEVTA